MILLLFFITQADPQHKTQLSGEAHIKARNYFFANNQQTERQLEDAQWLLKSSAQKQQQKIHAGFQNVSTVRVPPLQLRITQCAAAHLSKPCVKYL